MDRKRAQQLIEEIEDLVGKAFSLRLDQTYCDAAGATAAMNKCWAFAKVLREDDPYSYTAGKADSLRSALGACLKAQAGRDTYLSAIDALGALTQAWRQNFRASGGDLDGSA